MNNIHPDEFLKNVHIGDYIKMTTITGITHVGTVDNLREDPNQDISITYHYFNAKGVRGEGWVKLSYLHDYKVIPDDMDYQVEIIDGNSTSEENKAVVVDEECASSLIVLEKQAIVTGVKWGANLRQKLRVGYAYHVSIKNKGRYDMIYTGLTADFNDIPDNDKQLSFKYMDEDDDYQWKIVNISSMDIAKGEYKNPSAPFRNGRFTNPDMRRVLYERINIGGKARQTFTCMCG